jgi:hypothetical protein
MDAMIKCLQHDKTRRRDRDRLPDGSAPHGVERRGSGQDTAPHCRTTPSGRMCAPTPTARGTVTRVAAAPGKTGRSCASIPKPQPQPPSRRRRSGRGSRGGDHLEARRPQITASGHADLAAPASGGVRSRPPRRRRGPRTLTPRRTRTHPRCHQWPVLAQRAAHYRGPGTRDLGVIGLLVDSYPLRSPAYTAGTDKALVLELSEHETNGLIAHSWYCSPHVGHLE